MDWVRSAFVHPSDSVKVTRTTAGTFLHAAGGQGKKGKDGQGAFKGDWGAGTNYVQGDEVIRRDDDAVNNGLMGRFIAVQDIDHTVATPPGLDVGEAYWKHSGLVYAPAMIFTGNDTPYRITVLSTGDDGAGLPVLRIMANKLDAADGCIDLDLNLLPAGKHLYPQKLITCEETGPKQRWFICSDAEEITP